MFPFLIPLALAGAAIFVSNQDADPSDGRQPRGPCPPYRGPEPGPSYGGLPRSFPSTGNSILSRGQMFQEFEDDDLDDEDDEDEDYGSISERSEIFFDGDDKVSLFTRNDGY